MTRRHEADRALGAVHRVREVRERDSRLGLRGAIAEHLARSDRAAALATAAHQEMFVGAEHVSAVDWVSRRTLVRALEEQAQEARAEADAAGVIRVAAEEHWRLDRTRLLAVETMLDQRAGRRRDERAREAARGLDDLGGQRWLRARRAEEVDAR